MAGLSLMTRPTYYVLYNELTVPHLVWLALWRRPIILIAMPAVFSFLNPLLDRLAAFLVRRGGCQWAIDADPGLADLKELRIPRHHNDTFRVIEPWMRQAFGFDEFDAALAEDAMPARQVTCNAVFGLFDPIYLLDWFCRHRSPETGMIVGADAMVQGFYQAQFGAPPAFRLAPGLGVGVLVKLAVVVVVVLRLAIKVFGAIKLAPAPPQRYRVGIDFDGDGRDCVLFDDLVKDRTQILLLLRNPARATVWAKVVADRPHAIFGAAGSWRPARAVAELGQALRCVFRLAWRFRAASPGHVLQVLAIPLRRVYVRLLLTEIQFDAFWGRDDYNVEHILRTQELRRVGSVSLGLSHGLPISAIVLPMWRYIDYDVYYVLGRHILKYYQDTWSPLMRVEAIGSLGMTPERWAMLAAPRPNDIIFQAKVERTIEPLRSILVAVAQAFPDRLIHFQMKKSFAHTFLAKELLAVAETCPNVRPTTDSIYELFMKARILISDPSTIVVEAIQFGLAAFVLDLDGRKALYFRDFPGLCETDPAELIRRIQGIEDGRDEWRAEFFSDAVALPGRPLAEAVGAELAMLPAR